MNNRLPQGYRAISILEEIGIAIGVATFIVLATIAGVHYGYKKAGDDCLRDGMFFTDSKQFGCEEIKP